MTPGNQPVLGTPGATKEAAAIERPLTAPERGHRPQDPREAVPKLREQIDAIIAASPVPDHADHVRLVAARAALDPDD